MSYEVQEDDLRQAFGEFGQVESVSIITDKFSGKSKGFGFIEMSTKEAGQAAIDGMNGKEWKGRTVTVSEARPQTKTRDDRGGGHGGGRGRGPGGGGGRGGYGNKAGSGGGRSGNGGGRGGDFSGGGRGRG